MKDKKPLIFISWSKPLSKKVAVVLKTFLMRAFDLNGTDIFISTQNLTGNNNGWFNEILEHASSAAIIIPCLTRDSIKSPWLHFETGVGTCAKLYPSKVIPILFKIKIEDLGENMGMYNFHQMVHCDDLDSLVPIDESFSKEKRDTAYYETLLCRLIYYVGTFLRENNDELRRSFTTEFTYRIYDSYVKEDIKVAYENAINDAVKSLKEISDLYIFREFYLSRPMQGLSKNLAEEYDKVLKDMADSAQERSYKVFYGSKSPIQEEPGLSEYRLPIIKKAQMFVMIYPKLSGKNLAPSSCLIELGAALAYEKQFYFLFKREQSCQYLYKT